jgi:hypothetical protein
MEEKRGLGPMTKMDMYSAGDEGMMLFSSAEEKRIYELNQRMARLDGGNERGSGAELLRADLRADMDSSVRRPEMNDLVYRIEPHRDRTQ